MKKESLLKTILTLTIGLTILPFHVAQGGGGGGFFPESSCGSQEPLSRTPSQNFKTAIVGTWELVDLFCENGISLSEEQLAKAQSTINAGIEKTFNGNNGEVTLLMRLAFPSLFSSVICPFYVEADYLFTGESSLVMSNFKSDINGCSTASLLFTIYSAVHTTVATTVATILGVSNEALYDVQVNGNTLYLLTSNEKSISRLNCGKNVEVVEEYKRVIECNL